MPEQRGKQATADIKSEWTRAYQIYLRAPGDRYDKKKDRTARIHSVANELQLTRKQAKRRVRNYEAWQRNIKKRLVEPSPAAIPRVLPPRWQDSFKLVPQPSRVNPRLAPLRRLQLCPPHWKLFAIRRLV